MFGQATRQLESWLGETCDGAPIVTEPPGTETGPATIHVFLLQLRALKVVSDRRTAATEAVVRYIVAADGRPAADAHDLLGRIVAAPTMPRNVRVVPEPCPLEVWRAFGTPPRPALQIDVRIRGVRDVDHEWVVEEPLEVVVTPRADVARGETESDGRRRRTGNDGVEG